jgi:uncharacterized membrane protein YkvA (DUF1232 family)
MDRVAQLLLGLAVSLLAVWLALVVALAWSRPRGMLLGDLLRILPDTLRLVHALARDASLPRGVRVRLALLLAYLASPIDLVPDFIPVLGHADDAIVAALTLRAVLRAAGPDPIRRHWPGTPAGLEALWRVLRLPGTAAP